ncbi:MAG TPA: sigma-54 dependent transcriptional regulator [Terriglobales bacterium]|jgi:DNA-binding NtrC family response regulator|nr:sigma-54 dependent transcriptional regulator [Terriglobales bacterium]
MRPLRVIVIDDEPSTCAFLQAAFTAEGHQCHTFVRPEDAERHLANAEADLAMVDVYLGAVNGIDLLSRLRELKPELYPVIMTAHVSVETAARSVAEGAVDYVSKPLTIEQLRSICQRARGFRAQKAEPLEEVAAPVHDSAIIGSSAKMLAIYNAIGRVAASNVNVLITGASGTGKELVARAIHQHSKRAQQPFTPVNCGSFTETILESELFGHEKGAFTGANATHKGLVEASDGGTLFLDEVTETTLSFQVKLLRVIQEQQVRRVGSNKYVPVDVRIVAASNRDVPELIRQGQFREDLYYRLAVVQIAIPSLEERREDIPLLVRHFLQQFNAKNEREVSIEPEAVRRLQEMNWPGNVRELENTVNRLAIFAPTQQISRADVETEARRAQENRHPETAAAAAPDRLVELEREHIVRILKLTHGNKSEAARRLGIERKTLYKKALRLGIDLQSLDKK